MTTTVTSQRTVFISASNQLWEFESDFTISRFGAYLRVLISCAGAQLIVAAWMRPDS